MQERGKKYLYFSSKKFPPLYTLFFSYLSVFIHRWNSASFLGKFYINKINYTSYLRSLLITIRIAQNWIIAEQPKFIEHTYFLSYSDNEKSRYYYKRREKITIITAKKRLRTWIITSLSSVIILLAITIFSFTAARIMHSRRKLNFTVNSAEAIGITIPPDKIAINDDELRAKQLTDNPHPFSVSVQGKRSEKRETHFTRERERKRTIIDTCVMSRVDKRADSRKKTFFYSPALYIGASHRKIYICIHAHARVYFAQSKWEKYFLYPLLRE